jgi:hypothetical protein
LYIEIDEAQNFISKIDKTPQIVHNIILKEVMVQFVRKIIDIKVLEDVIEVTVEQELFLTQGKSNA